MENADSSELSDESLVELFINACINQDNNNDVDKVNEYNKFFRIMTNIVEEMKSRPGDSRNLLIPLFQNTNWQVRVKAAKNAFALAPTEARQVLEEIYATRVDPYAADAGGMLMAIDRGSYTPK